MYGRHDTHQGNSRDLVRDGIEMRQNIYAPSKNNTLLNLRRPEKINFQNEPNFVHARDLGGILKQDPWCDRPVTHVRRFQKKPDTNDILN